MLENPQRRGIGFKTAAADAFYDVARVSEMVEKYGAEPAISCWKYLGMEDDLGAGHDFIVCGVKRLVDLFGKRVSIASVLSKDKATPNKWL